MLMMGVPQTWFNVFLKGLWLILCLVMLQFNIRFCSADCLSTETHLNCFSKDLFIIKANCTSSATKYGSSCDHIYPQQIGPPKDWIPAERIGAWYKVIFFRLFSMTKIIIQQRSAEFSQINEVAIEFDTGPSLQVTLTQNVNVTFPPVFDQMTFPSRTVKNVKLTILSMHTKSSEYTGLRRILIYDENCDRDYQEMNLEHRSNNRLAVQSWSPFTGAIKMFTSFHKALTLYFTVTPSLVSDSYQVNIDTERSKYSVYRQTDGALVLMHQKSFWKDLTKPHIISFHLKDSKLIIRIKADIIELVDITPLDVKYWGIACSSNEPVQLTYWKHIGKCYEKADYYWLADKLLGGTTIAELRQGRDGQIQMHDFKEAKVLSYGPLIGGHTSSALYLSGAQSAGPRLGNFHSGCFSDITGCTGGYTVAFWMSILEFGALKQILWMTQGRLYLAYTSGEGKIRILTKTNDYSASIYVPTATWNHVFIFWDPVKGVTALVNNKDEYTGSVSSVGDDVSERGYTTLEVGSLDGYGDPMAARMAIRDVALWERRLSLIEAREYYHCNNFEIPKEFVANRRVSMSGGAFPFPGENIARHECTFKGGSPCKEAIDNSVFTFSSAIGQTITIVLKFDRDYVVNKASILAINVETLSMKFKDGSREEFKVIDQIMQEIRLQDKVTDSIELVGQCDAPTSLGFFEVRVYYDFSRDRLPSTAINWVLGCRVSLLGSNLLIPLITDGLTSDDGMIIINTTAGAGATAPSEPFPALNSNWIQIEVPRIVKVNLIRLWLVNDIASYDHLKTFRLEFSNGNHFQFHVLLPGNNSWSEFVFEPQETHWISIHIIDTHETTYGRIAIKEVELFYDTSKDLPASKTIIGNDSNRTMEKGLSTAKFGAFDFLLTVDIKMTQPEMYVVGRRTDLGFCRTMLRTTSDYKLYVRYRVEELYSKSVVADGAWHNVKLFYNAKEGLISLFIDNRNEVTRTLQTGDEPDGWDWEEGDTLDSDFTGTLKNFRIHQAVRGVGMETRKIPDSALSVTSASSDATGAEKSRLNGQGAWVVDAENTNEFQYLEVDLGIASHITYVAFQGMGAMWVTWARISYSMDNTDWTFLLDKNEQPQIFRASHDNVSIAMVMMYSPVVARYIRIHPNLANVGMALRTEIYDHDYGLPFNLILAKHVPSYQGCVDREKFFSKLQIFLPSSSFKSLASTPEDCKYACALEDYMLAGLFQGVVCYCTKTTASFKELSDEHCSFSCPGNPVLRCGGETSVSLYDTGLKPSAALCSNCIVGVFPMPHIAMFSNIEIFTNSSGNVSYIDVSVNGVDIGNITSGSMEHMFASGGQMHVVAEARDALGQQVAVASKKITVQHALTRTDIDCPEWVRKGESYECSMYVQRGTDTNVNCTIGGERLPLEFDDNMLITTGNMPEYPVTTQDNPSPSSIIMPTQAVFLGGLLVAYELVTTGRGSVTIQVFESMCLEGQVYCTTSLSCVIYPRKECPDGVYYPATAHTFPSTGKFCNNLDAYCPAREVPLNLTTQKLIAEETIEVADAGHHLVPSSETIWLKPGYFLGYVGTNILQHKSSGVSFRAEETSAGMFSPVARIDGTAMVRGHYWRHRRVHFDMNETGELSCTLSNDISVCTYDTYINMYEEIEDVVLTFPNVSATNQSVLFVVNPHSGGVVSYTFRFGEKETILLENRTSSQNLTLNYTFTESGQFQLNLTVRNLKSSFNISAWIRILDPIEELAWPSPFYMRVHELANISWSAKFGEQVTLSIEFGDGVSATVGPCDLGPETGVLHTYESLGTYTTSLVAENAVSAASITGLIIVMEPVCNVSVTVETELALAEEPVVLSASVSKGIDVEYLVLFTCNETGISLPEEQFSGDKLITSFAESCVYDYHVFGYNNVSAALYIGSLIVEDAAIVNLRAMVGLSIAGESTVLTVAVDSGGVTFCTWDFGDGAKKTLPFVAPVEHVYSTGGKYVLNLNCSNHLKSANASLDIEVLVYITQMDIMPLGGQGPEKDTFPIEDPLMFNFATNGIFVNFTVNFGDSGAPDVTEDTSLQHIFPSVGSYYVTVNVSNAISFKTGTISVTLLQSVMDIVLETNGPVKLGEAMLFEVTIGQIGTSACYYFNLGGGTEFIYKVDSLTTCIAEYKHVTDIRAMTSSKISFAHIYTNLTVYQVTCTGSNLVSSVVAEIEAVIVQMPCTQPVVSIEGLSQILNDPREIMRSAEFEVMSKNTIDCEETSETDFEWKVFEVSPEGFSEKESVEVVLSDIKMDEWKISFKSRSLDYGLYYISFTLSMVGVEGVSSSTFGYVRIIPSPIIAEIRGGSTRVFGFEKVIPLDGGVSRDPDGEEGDYEGMYFYWHCKRSDDNYTFPAEPEAIKPPMKANTTNSTRIMDYGGCFGNGPGRLNYSNTTFGLDLDTGLMLENVSYFLQLLVKKDSRRNVFELVMKIIPGDPPTVGLSCLRNCQTKFNPTVKVSLEVTCEDCKNYGNMNYRWEVYLYTAGSWDLLDNTDDILTWPSSPNLVMKEESLLGNRTYKIRVQVWRPGGIPGVAEIIRTVNIPPFGGWCFASPQTGIALDTLYGVTCGDWIDDNLPLKYAFSYSPGGGTLESMVYVGENSFSPNVTFPTGQEENNTLYFVVLVTDSLGASTLVQLQVQVNPTNGALKSKVEEMASGNGTLSTLISSGDTQNALQMISVFGNMLNFASEKDENTESADARKNSTGELQEESNKTKTQDQEFKEENTKLRTSLVTVISTAPVKTLDDAQRTAAVLGTVTKETGEVSSKAQDTATSTLEIVGNVLESAATKPGTHPRTVAKTAEAVLSGLGNVIQAAFFVEEPASQEPKIDEKVEGNDEGEKTETVGPTEASSDTEKDDEKVSQEKQRKRELANKLMTVIRSVAKAVTTNKAPGETRTRIDTAHLSLEVYRESPEELSMEVLNARSGSFALPQMGSILNGSGIVDVSTVATPTNPFEDKANRINSVVMTTEIRNASGGISISNLDEPIDIRLPREPKPVLSHRLYQATAGKMIFHKFDVTHNDSSINIDLHLVGNCSERANFSLFLQKDRKPSVLKHMFNITIPDFEPMTQNNASKSPYTFFLSNLDLNRVGGRFFVGVMYNRPDPECPDFMNYTLDLFTSGCLYWDEEVNIWKGDGCTVGFLTNINETQCLCTHLTSFGGDFVVPPNSIDWSAVTAGFANLDENPVVFAVVVSFIALYFILLVWVRRKDKKDLEEFVTIPLPDNDPRDSYNYEVVVYTGHPKNSGTTAKVFIIVSGNRDETEPRALLDSTNNALKPGGVDTFILSVPSSLGKLDHIRVWHDTSGDSASWYLNRILVRDVQTDRKSWFLCDQWLAVEEEDGLIERVLPAATKDDLVSFNFLFSIEARRKLFDEHLWFSVLARRPRNQFTRAQRLSCCLALLLSTMLANAMFYQTDDTSSSGTQVQAGPLAFSLKQAWIGFISCLVVLPANLLIVYIFRNVRPKDSGGSSDGGQDSGSGEKYALKEEPETENLSDPTENLASCSKTSLPRKFIYVAYMLLFLTISVSALFTIFYGFTFGKEKSEKWISSTLLSFFQDLMLLQPLKVFAAATFIALIIKDPNKVDQGDKSDSKPEAVEQVEDQPAGNEEQLIIGGDNFRGTTTPRRVVKPPAEAELVAVRELRTKQKKMRRIISEVCWYVAYLVLITIVAYGNRDPKAYLVTKTMNDMFVENKYAARLQLNDISSIPKYWSWLYNSILPAINPPYWYGPHGLDDIETISKSMASKSRAKAKSKTSKTKASGGSGEDALEEIYHGYPKHFTADTGVSYVVGLARARQLRNAPQDSCVVHPTVRHLQHHCSKEYSWSTEDEGCYNVSWSKYNGSEHNCKQMKAGKSPWRYHTAWDLKGTPFWGQLHNYWGGGYVWNLDSSLSVIQEECKQLEAQSWLDQQTQAIFFEFTVYNAFTNFFCSVTLLVEKHITGGIYPYVQLHTLKLYHYIGAEAIVTLVCEIIFVGVLCYLFSRELKEARSQGLKIYFKDPWNYFDILGLIFSFTAIGLYFARIAATSLALKQINENQSVFVSFHYVSAIDQSFTTLLGLAVFVYFLKFLRILRFNRKISLLSTTIIACTSTLLGFMLTYILLFAAYAQVLYLVYGQELPEYSTFQRCLSSLMEMTLGSSDFDGMNNTNRILTSFVFFSYTLLNTCVYMNLFISILSETFSAVRGDVLLQPNDHEIVDFMIKTLKKAVFNAVEPMTDPIYREPKDHIDIGVDKIAETSECIQGALQVLCKEEIRQSLWFRDRSQHQQKKVLMTILLESGEIFNDNDICDAVPLLDDILRKLTMEDLLIVRDNQRRKIASDLAKSLNASRRRSRFSQSESCERCSSDEEDGVGGGYDDVGSCGNVSDSMETNGIGDRDEGTISGGDENVECRSRTGDSSGDGDDGDGDGDDGDGDDGNVYDNDNLKEDRSNSDGGYSDRDDGSCHGDDKGDHSGDDDICHGGDHSGDDGDDDKLGGSNHALHDGDSDSDENGTRSGDQTDDGGAHRETDHEDNPTLNRPDEDIHGSYKLGNDHDRPKDTESYRSDSPRSDSCVIIMETK